METQTSFKLPHIVPNGIWTLDCQYRIQFFPFQEDRRRPADQGGAIPGSQHQNSMQIFIKDTRGKVHTLEIEKNAKVTYLKEKVYGMLGIPPEQQRLVFNGKQLEDSKTLQDYNITAESTVFLLLRLRGGNFYIDFIFYL